MGRGPWHGFAGADSGTSSPSGTGTRTTSARTSPAAPQRRRMPAARRPSACLACGGRCSAASRCVGRRARVDLDPDRRPTAGSHELAARWTRPAAAGSRNVEACAGGPGRRATSSDLDAMARSNSASVIRPRGLLGMFPLRTFAHSSTWLAAAGCPTGTPRLASICFGHCSLSSILRWSSCSSSGAGSGWPSPPVSWCLMSP